MLSRVFSDATAQWTSQVWWCGTAGGTANALQLSRGGLPDLTDGMTLRFRAAATNTGAVTASWCGRATVALTTPVGAALPAGTLRAGWIYDVTCYGGALILKDGPSYEEGTWTPALALETPGTSAWTQANSGDYTRIGNRVFFNCSISATLTSLGAGSGPLHITGLPFVAAAEGAAAASLVGGAALTWGGGPATALGVRIVNGNAYMRLVGTKSATAHATIAASNITVGSNMGFYISGQYRI